MSAETSVGGSAGSVSSPRSCFSSKSIRLSLPPSHSPRAMASYALTLRAIASVMRDAESRSALASEAERSLTPVLRPAPSTSLRRSTFRRSAPSAAAAPAPLSVCLSDSSER
eukprot:scaffold4162_cov53-Phaeocystis_antarctica.AAC.1